MKCNECGNHISRWDAILPWRKAYKLLVEDEGDIIEKVRICKECYEFYKQLMKMVEFLGTEKVIDILESYEKGIQYEGHKKD